MKSATWRKIPRWRGSKLPRSSRRTCSRRRDGRARARLRRTRTRIRPGHRRRIRRRGNWWWWGNRRKQRLWRARNWRGRRFQLVGVRCAGRRWRWHGNGHWWSRRWKWDWHGSGHWWSRRWKRNRRRRRNWQWRWRRRNGNRRWDWHGIEHWWSRRWKRNRRWYRNGNGQRWSRWWNWDRWRRRRRTWRRMWRRQRRPRSRRRSGDGRRRGHHAWKMADSLSFVAQRRGRRSCRPARNGSRNWNWRRIQRRGRRRSFDAGIVRATGEVAERF